MSKTVMLEREGVMEQIRRAIAESGIPEEERVLLCSMHLFLWLSERIGAWTREEMQRKLGADLIGLGYLEDRKIIVTDRESARKIAPESVQAGRA